jgi:nucleotide-binding universal stress UspA family protein
LLAGPTRLRNNTRPTWNFPQRAATAWRIHGRMPTARTIVVERPARHVSCSSLRRRVTMSRFHTIVAAVDFSQTSEDVLETACELTRPHGHVHLLHVVPDPLQTLYVMEPAGLDLTALQNEWIEAAREQLKALAARQQPPPEFLTTAVVTGAAAPEIVRYADAHKADLIVVGSHGRGFLDRLILGNVAERVLRQANCPVTVVPHRARPELTSFEVKAAAGVGS